MENINLNSNPNNLKFINFIQDIKDYYNTPNPDDLYIKNNPDFIENITDYYTFYKNNKSPEEETLTLNEYKDYILFDLDTKQQNLDYFNIIDVNIYQNIQNKNKTIKTIEIKNLWIFFIQNNKTIFQPNNTQVEDVIILTNQYKEDFIEWLEKLINDFIF